MTLYTTNRDGGKTNEAGHLRAIYKTMTGEVISGLSVSENSPTAMTVLVSTGEAFIPRSDGAAHFIWSDAVKNVTITAANAINPRKDYVVAYIDNAVTPTTASANNPNDVVKIISVAGTAAPTPSDPTSGQIETAVGGASNPYIILARIDVPANDTLLTNSQITDLRDIAKSALQPYSNANNGWDAANEDWVYASATTVTVPTDATLKYSEGMLVRFSQSTGGLKYAAIKSLTSTVLTLDMISGTIVNETISSPYYSYAATPLGAGLIPHTRLATGTVVQTVSVGYSAVATGTGTIPLDDSIPQSGEGNEFMSLAITPKSATNILIIDVILFGGLSIGNADLIVGIFQDSGANAVAADAYYMATATGRMTIPVRHRMAAGTTSSTTFKVRAGGSGAGTTTFNGFSSARMFSTVTKSSIVITEVKA